MASTDRRQFMFTRQGLLLLTGGMALVFLALNSWDHVGPQSLICRHRDDPRGRIDFRVDVGRGEDRVRFVDGQILPVETSRDQITFLEKESNSFHLTDHDNDEAGLGVVSEDERELGIPSTTRSVVIHVDHSHDVEHRTTIDRHHLTFQEQSLTQQGQSGEVIMTGRCRSLGSNPGP